MTWFNLMLSHHFSTLELVFPVPLRTLFLLIHAPLLFSLNLKFLTYYNIPAHQLLGVELNFHSKLSRLYYILLGTVFIPCFVGYNLTGWYATGDKFNQNSFNEAVSLLFFISSIAVLGILAWPYNILYKEIRWGFWKSCYRIIFEGFHSAIPFSDVIMADIFTSYSRVIGDVFSLLMESFQGDKSSSPSTLWSHVLSPCIICLPFFFRLRQCTAEFFNSSCTDYKHLANALKYASSFPVVFLSPIISDIIYKDDPMGSWLFWPWLILILFNSCYSFYWDVVMDWHLATKSNRDLTMFKVYPLLSRELVFVDPLIYYMILIINFLLRLTWVLKLNKDVNINDAPFSSFTFELLELLRRFFWVFLRLERQYLSDYKPVDI